MSTYERQKSALAPQQPNDSVGGFASSEVCSKCGQADTRMRKCAHCGDELLCQSCFFDPVHYTEYLQNYDLHETHKQEDYNGIAKS
jgi:hypothetical protein